MNELVEDGVFDSEQQRERFRMLYKREVQSPSWWQGSTRWVMTILAVATTICLAYWALRVITG